MEHAGLRGDVRGEWDELKQHDVVFLLTVRPPDQATLAMLRADGAEPSPIDAHGLIYVRGAEVIEVGCQASFHLCSFLGGCINHALCRHFAQRLLKPSTSFGRCFPQLRSRHNLLWIPHFPSSWPLSDTVTPASDTGCDIR